MLMIEARQKCDIVFAFFVYRLVWKLHVPLQGVLLFNFFVRCLCCHCGVLITMKYMSSDISWLISQLCGLLLVLIFKLIFHNILRVPGNPFNFNRIQLFESIK